MGRLPIQGKIFCSRRIKIRSPWFLLHFGVNLACQSLATASKLFSSAIFFERLTEFFNIPGSIVLVNCRRASSRASLASAKLISEKAPKESFFSTPEKRYLNFQSFEPLGFTNKYKPFSSASL